MSRLTQNGTAELVSQAQIIRRERGQGNVHAPCSVDYEQDWQPYPVDLYFAICDDHIYIREQCQGSGGRGKKVILLHIFVECLGVPQEDTMGVSLWRDT